MDRRISVFQYHIYPTMYCSLSCQHCFLDKDIRADKTKMSVEQFKKVVDTYVEHFTKNDIDRGEVTIIGGEATTIPPKFYHEVMPYLREKFDSVGKHYHISLVTNFLHLKSLQKYSEHFDIISTSYEPMRFTEKNLKANAEQKGEIWLKNVKEWLSEGNELHLSLTTARDLIDAGTDFYEEMMGIGFKHFAINQGVPEGEFLKNSISEDHFNTHESKRIDELMAPVRKRRVFEIQPEKQDNVFVTFEEETQYMIELTEWYLKQREAGREFYIYPLDSYATGVSSNTLIDDIACTVSKGLNTRPDGKTTGCAAEVGSKEMLEYGNVYEQSLEEIVNSDVRNQYVAATERVYRECLQCEFYRICKGNCMLRARLWDRSNPENECHGLKGYLTYLKSRAEEVLKYSPEH